MAIYEFLENELRQIDETTFQQEKIQERTNLQPVLRNQIEIVSPDTLIISEEFGQWEDSNRRIDLLGIDKDANLVVIELKRTEDGGHMELQAIRYAAMISAMTFESAVENYSNYLEKNGIEKDASKSLLNFLGWEEPDEDAFAQDVRIVLVSADFSRELTTAVIWLNERGLNLECVRIKPYKDADRVLLDIQQIIPLPEAEDYQVRLKEKQQRERSDRKSKSKRDYTKFDVTVGAETFMQLSKRKAIYMMVRFLVEQGKSPEEISEVIPFHKGKLFRKADGQLDMANFLFALESAIESGGKVFDETRYYCKDEELLIFEGNTYAFNNQWGKETAEAMSLLMTHFSNVSMSYT